MSNLYGSYDAFVGGGGQDLYGSYDAMPGAPGGGQGYDMGQYAGNYNSYDSYIGNGAGYGAPQQQGYGYADPYAQSYGAGPGYPSRAPHPSIDLQDTRGVGITFDQKPSVHGSSPVFVKRVASNSSAARTGQVRVGDVLMAVNGVNVSGKPIAALRPIIPGPAGSTVCLSFRRYDGRVYDVNLRRTTPRLGSKNSRYYSGIRNTAPQSPPAAPRPQYGGGFGGYGAPPPFYGYGGGYGPAAAGGYSTMLAPGATMMAPGASYIMSQPQILSQPQLISQPISYIQAPAQSFTTQYTNGQFSNGLSYQQVGGTAEEIKGTQV